MNKAPVLPHIQLLGDKRENLYQLGKKDSLSYKSTFSHMEKLFQSGLKPLDFTISQGLKLLSKQIAKNYPEYKRECDAYADGLGITSSKYTSILLLPEIMSCISKWIPALPIHLFGCSSAFALENEGVAHARILDFPLAGTYDLNERMVYQKWENEQAVISYGSSGIPFPAITAMNESGVSMALHQKFNETFYKKGMPIFHLVDKLMHECHDANSIVNFLKKVSSVTHWGLYISCSDGSVISCDLMGDKSHIEIKHLSEGEILYFNNQHHHPKLKKFNPTPQGIASYNEGRECVFKKKVEKLGDKKIDSLELLKILSSPLPMRSKTAKDAKVDTITLDSVAISTMNAAKGEMRIIPGEAPKVLLSEHLIITNMWQRKLQSKMTSSKLGRKNNQDFKNILSELCKAQSFFDRNIHNEAFHHIQLARDIFPSHPYSVIAEFYFLVFQYITHSNTKDMHDLLEGFLAILNELPEHLKQHALLFIMRLEIRLKLKVGVKKSDFSSDYFKQLFDFEKKLKPIAITALSKLIAPRLEIWDVLYLYYK